MAHQASQRLYAPRAAPVLIAGLFLPLTLYAEDLREVPTTLFGIQLGTVVQFDKSNPNTLIGLDGIYIADTSHPMRSFMSRNAVTVDFIPADEYPEFPNRHTVAPTETEEEARVPAGARPIESTSFSLRLVPINLDALQQPEDLSRLHQIPSLEFEVVRISWWSPGTKPDDVEWAREICALFALDFDVKPVEKGGSTWLEHYSCKFQQGPRTLEVSSLLARGIALYFDKSLSEEAFLQKREQLELEEKRRELQRIRPY